MHCPTKLILDADGVLLDERPYWNAALATALDRHDLFESVADEFPFLTTLAFEQLGMQRLAKQYGCNSNWDLAAIIARALDNRELKQGVRVRIENGDGRGALSDICIAVARLAADGANRIATASGHEILDPLMRFDLDRNSESFQEMCATYDHVLGRTIPKTAGMTAPWASREPVEVLRETLKQLDAGGFELCVCTGRTRREIAEPLRLLGLDDLLPPERIVCHDDVQWAEAQTKTCFLGKPHWFPIALAANGFDAAVALLKNDRPSSLQQKPVFVGDALADFSAAENYCSIGLPLDYVHVRSGVTSEDENALITGAACTVACIEKLSELPALLSVCA